MNLSELTWPEIKAVSKDTPIVFPIAAVEQHGRHLPVFTDSMLLGEVCRRAAASLGSRILWAPLQWLGNSEHHMDFPGTLSSAPRSYLDLLSDLAENAIHHGFKRIIFLNGHGGNDVPGRQAMFEVRQKHRQRKDLLLSLATYWSLGGKPWERDNTIHQREMGHACEWETSMILRIAPHLVKAHQDAAPVEFGRGVEPAFRAWTTPDRSPPGHIGFPHLATATKGEILFQTFTADVVALLERAVHWDGQSWDV